MIEVYDFYARTGSTHKIIGIDEIVQDVLDNEVNTISVISSGNYLDAILEKIKEKGLEGILKVVNLVNRLSEDTGDGYNELLIKERMVLKDAEERQDYVSANLKNTGKVKDYTDYIPKALEEYAEGMLASAPDYISLGVGTGKLAAVLCKIIEDKELKTKLIMVVPKGENGIFNKNNLYEKGDKLYYKKFKPKSLADKLSTPYTFFKGEIEKAMKDGHVIIQATNKDFKKANRKATELGRTAGVSGSAGFVLYDEGIRKRYGIKEDSYILIVNTGKGSKEEVIEEQLSPWYVRALKPAGALAASILLALGINYSVNQYQDYQSERNALVHTASIVAQIIDEKIDINEMSNKELYQYILKSKKGIGGPPHYW